MDEEGAVVGHRASVQDKFKQGRKSERSERKRK